MYLQYVFLKYLSIDLRHNLLKLDIVTITHNYELVFHKIVSLLILINIIFISIDNTINVTAKY